MIFANELIIVRGGGDLATAVTYRLHKSGFPVIVLELERPLVVRRRVAVATAVLEGQVTVEGMQAQRADTVDGAMTLIQQGIVPVMVAPELEVVSNQLAVTREQSTINSQQSTVNSTQPSALSPQHLILIDARMAKRNIDTRMDQADLVIALGPGFMAGVDCHAVIETMRGHRLGRVIWDGGAIPNTGTPGIVAGKGAERVLRAPLAGIVNWRVEIGDSVKAGEAIGAVSGERITVPFDGVLRGLIAEGTAVRKGLKIGDVDARLDRDACFTISDKALAIAGGVLEAIFTYLNTNKST
ncbi:MAG: EF2563 family selenium-dependent molybdenum hydroxylase system protein [Chloroflexi bacterium]|nr:EF2563 family selenium-dependent molybdenum hydroxylase system protein [Chloroflexota bacterium]